MNETLRKNCQLSINNAKFSGKGFRNQFSNNKRMKVSISLMNSFNCALVFRIKYMNLGRSGGQFNQVDTSWAFSVLSAVLVLWGNRISSVVQKLKFQHKQNMLFATFFENFTNFLLLRNVLGNIRNIIFSSDCSYLSLDVIF